MLSFILGGIFTIIVLGLGIAVGLFFGQSDTRDYREYYKKYKKDNTPPKLGGVKILPPDRLKRAKEEGGFESKFEEMTQ